MARKGKSKKAIVKLDAQGNPKGRVIPKTINKTLDTVMGVQRPLVLAHLNGIRAKHPDASVLEITEILERRYLLAVTGSGAATGATAVIPAIGTVAALALSAAETVAFLEATALFAQSVAELHGVAVEDPERARGLVLALMLGKEGSDMIRQWGLEALNEDITRAGYWGAVVSEQIPNALVTPLVNKLKNAFLKKTAARFGAHTIGKILPYGLGAVIGGIGNNVIGRRVVKAARNAFPPEAVNEVIVLEDARAKKALQG